MLPTGNILHISFMLIMSITPISISRGKNEITPFKEKISLRKSLLILGLHCHYYVNREFVHAIMAAISISAITARCNEPVYPAGHLRARQWDGGAIEDHWCARDLQRPHEHAQHVCEHRAVWVPHCAPFESDLALSCTGLKMKSCHLKALL